MMSELDYGLVLAAWLTGLAGGSGHCIGMCGGILGALGLGYKRGLEGSLLLFCAHAGRIAGYALAGALAGFAGAAIVATAFGPDAVRLMRFLAAGLILLIGLKLLLGLPLLAGIEKLGGRAWRRIAPVFRGLLPARSPGRALLVGLFWGWLPCGLVYAQLSVAAASGSALTGAVLMVAFGLGTSVSLSVLSVLLQSLGIARLPRQLSGALLILFAVWTALPLLTAMSPTMNH